MKRFNVETCTQKEFEVRRKCWSTKQEVWDLVNKFYEKIMILKHLKKIC